MKICFRSMRSVFSLFLCCALAEFSFAQNTWVVSNDPSFYAADFDNIQEAIDSASSGDKIYVHGSPFAYNPFTLAKKLHLIGSGFWKVENDIPDENFSHSYINNWVTMNAGCDSSIFEGFVVEGINLNDCDNLILRYNILNHYGTAPKINFAGLPINTMVYGNYFSDQGTLNGSAVSSNIFNNVFLGNNNTNHFWNNNSGNVDCLVQNNAFTYNLSWMLFLNCTFRNNIVSNGDTHFDNCVIENNIFVDDIVTVGGVPTDSLGNGNIDSVNINTIWNLGNPSPDGKYQLIGDSTTNVAYGAGINGEDCGPFGGDSPYRLSGIVKVPTIYQMIIPLLGDTTNMLNIKIRAKSN